MEFSGKVRAGRGYLNWLQDDLASHAGLGIQSIRNIESENTSPTARTQRKIERAFALHGLTFTSRGIEITEAPIIYEGKQGFEAFMDDVFETMRFGGGVYRVSNVDESNWLKWLGEDNSKARRDRTTALENVSARIMVRRGDKLLTATDYAEYRTVPDAIFSEGVSSYIYGDKYAIIHFQPDAVRVLVLHDGAIADAQRCWFDAVWDGKTLKNND